MQCIDESKCSSNYFERLAVTEQRIADHALFAAPVKVSDNRSPSGISTIQAEALPPDVAATVVPSAIEADRDTDILARVLRREEDQRHELLRRLHHLGDFTSGRDESGG
ncbi:hypothetical protein [Streptomyces cirratus]|nr:hypothetical protein [Streptomyces cirratus]